MNTQNFALLSIWSSGLALQLFLSRDKLGTGLILTQRLQWCLFTISLKLQSECLWLFQGSTSNGWKNDQNYDFPGQTSTMDLQNVFMLPVYHNTYVCLHLTLRWSSWVFNWARWYRTAKKSSKSTKQLRFGMDSMFKFCNKMGGEEKPTIFVSSEWFCSAP